MIRSIFSSEAVIDEKDWRIPESTRSAIIILDCDHYYATHTLTYMNIYTTKWFVMALKS